MDENELEKFKNYLTNAGAVVQPSTNPFELVRFKTQNGKSIVYTNKHGIITSFSSDEAHDAYTKFKQNKPLKLVNRKRAQLTARKKNLAIRDGKQCFFCGEKMRIDQLTVEHLLSFSHGGTDNPNNLCLACQPCNKEVGNGSVVSKILFRERKRSEVYVRTQTIPAGS